MATLKIRPRPEQVRQLLRCAAIEPDLLLKLVSHLGKLTPLPLLPDGLLKEFRQILSEEESEVLLGQVLSLSMLIRQTESKPVEVTRALRAAIEENEAKAKWDSIATHFQAILDSGPVRIVTKAMELSYEFANLMRNVRILTDLRPLFDEDGVHVDGAVVTHTLRITYSSEDGSHELSLAMDVRDIERLRRECERSITKARSIRDRFVEGTSKPCLISGESEGEGE